MSKQRPVFRCEACGATGPRWEGRCGACGEWNTVCEELPAGPVPGGTILAMGGVGPGGPPARAMELRDVDLEGRQAVPTGLAELDRVLTGGLLPGSATLLGGEPGTGKSTLLLQAMASMARSGKRCLLVAAEEAAHQVRRRAQRLGADVPGLFVVEATTLSEIAVAVAGTSPDVVVVDSVQAVTGPGAGSPAGSLVQVRVCAHSLVAMAKATGAALVLVGHVTKDGSLAGPRALEHLVDTVLSFEGDRYSSLRALRAVKHRFGPTGETGLFEMREAGLSGVADPSSLFLADRLVGSPGSAVTVPMEGYRPLLVEVQALVGRSSQVPRRSVTGADPGRVAFLVAVLDRRARVPIGDSDIYVSVAGGARACEPAADLAICLALTSSLTGAPVRPDIVALGEVGLGGEVRRVGSMSKRLREAQRLGFASALVPEVQPGRSEAPRVLGPSTVQGPQVWRLLEAATLLEALSLAFAGAGGSARRGTAKETSPGKAIEPQAQSAKRGGAGVPDRFPARRAMG